MASSSCPICGKSVAASALERHVNACLDSPAPAPASPPAAAASSAAAPLSADEELARRLQQEDSQWSKQLDDDEQLARMLAEGGDGDGDGGAATATSGGRGGGGGGGGEDRGTCQQCKATVAMSVFYILDDCTHRFCRDCLEAHVEAAIRREPTVRCPLADCPKPLSVRDMGDLLPRIKARHASAARSYTLVPTGGARQRGSAKATERLLAELKHIAASAPDKAGYSVEPIDDNLYRWEVRMFNFDGDIGEDLKRLRTRDIVLEVAFPSTFPFNPPFVRVIRPRFAFRTGHVTIGGAICNEGLTNTGWSPANTIEAVLLGTRANFIEGAGRLDRTQTQGDYTPAEAHEAFDRLCRVHGWT